MSAASSPEVVLATAGCEFEHQRARYAVPAFALARGGAVALGLPHAATGGEVEFDGVGPDADDSAADDLGESLLGLAPLASGTANLFGHDVRRTGRAALLAARRRVAFAPLRPAFLSTVPVPDNVAIPLRDRCDPPDGELFGAVHAKLAALGVPIVGRVLPGQLTPRARYLAGIARALLARPEVLVIALPEVDLPRELARVLTSELLAARRDGVTTLVLGGTRAAPLLHVDSVVQVRLAPRAEPKANERSA